MLLARLIQQLLLHLILSADSQALASATKTPKYVTLPPLREQSTIQDTWTQQRLDNVPNILKKYDVDAWLMSQHEHTEDTIFWSLKAFTQFSARRRTVDLFLSSPLPSDPKNKTHYSWIDNTPKVWDELSKALEEKDPKKLVVNVDADIAFSAGLHVGEMEEMEKRLEKKWTERFVREPMIGVEFVGWMGEAEVGKGKLGWYKGLMETAWACIGEGFSEKVITPGVTTTEARIFTDFCQSVPADEKTGRRMVAPRESSVTKLHNLVST